MLNKPGPSATPGEKSFYKRIENVISQKNEIIRHVEPDIRGPHLDILLILSYNQIKHQRKEDSFQKKYNNFVLP